MTDRRENDLRMALSFLYSRYENGGAVYEYGVEDPPLIGHTVKLSEDEENYIVAAITASEEAALQDDWEANVERRWPGTDLPLTDADPQPSPRYAERETPRTVVDALKAALDAARVQHAACVDPAYECRSFWGEACGCGADEHNAAIDAALAAATAGAGISTFEWPFYGPQREP
jgi:hypothetical protein